MSSHHKDKDVRQDRHSGDPKSSVNPDVAVKKGGAGGAGTWGNPTDQSGPGILDKGDPNYNSDGDEANQAM
jgi:hypothetical protein|eukprot:CAMPEP_0174280150 /NCGR_PEP_ID=MMETSP0809-20121228/414_1 /TAXON_ID=73025 ORGANISM="Eutreptiella gymnastica-like, Strain CCMP1594" /NCGR_SAMPLE_ID=MMETSP0809 /ASSEMBLY_ACC=CAM_ASM_000658 /LENGTH=70 /DNA_ID=CAMNT_0015372857 /DNA_START=25 /DNA_END=237 /DNA_ORIENTATION=+